MPGAGVSCRLMAGSTGRRVPDLDCVSVLRWSGWLVGHGDDGGGDPGEGVLRAGVAEAAGRLRLAGAVPVSVGDGAILPDFPGQRLVAGSPGADGGENRAAGAGVGDLAGPDGLPGAASLPGGDRCEGGVAGDAAGHLGAGGPGCEFLPDQVRAAGAEHRPGSRAGA